MPDKVYAFSQHIGNLCVTHDTNVHKLGAKLGIDPAELLSAFNGRAPASKAVVAGLAKALDTDVRFLDRLPEEIRKDPAAKGGQVSELQKKKGKSLVSNTPPTSKLPSVQE